MLSRSGGAEGLFWAVGAVTQRFTTDSQLDECYHTCTLSTKHQAWTYLGASLDFGGQAILPGGFALGGSVGLLMRAPMGPVDANAFPLTWNAAHGPGLRPRVQLTLGWAFL
jgi:hypothetical protein